MFSKLRRARADLATMNRLFPAAESIARAEGAEKPAGEHLLLAALDLEDGIARATLARHGLGGEDLRGAVQAVHAEALSSLGLAADDGSIDAALPPPRPAGGVYRSEGSMQTLFQRAVRLAKDEGSALTSGHILRAAAEAEHSAPARALARLGVTPLTL